MFLQGFADRNATHDRESIIVLPVNDTQGIEPVKTRSTLAVFNISERSSGYLVIGTLPPVGNALA
jgi:hypothetical protein